MRNLTLFFLITLLLNFSCKKNDLPEIAEKFIDYGYISSCGLPTASQMFYFDGQIFVGTDDGIWKINLSEKVWKRAGLDGKKVTCIYSHPTIGGLFYAGTESTGPTDTSLHISDNTGLTWKPASSAVFNAWDNRFETYTDLRVRPGFPLQIFANLSGTTIAVSKDGGLTWNRHNYAADSYFGLNCVINFLDNNPNEIYQGAEAPLDQAWLGKYSMDAQDPVILGELQQLIGTNYEWENRRPNCLETFSFNPGTFYVGMEGALSKVKGATWRYLFKGEEAQGNFPYSYIKGVWLDPSDTNHIIFGGGVNGTNTTLSLYETFDDGATITQLKDKLEMTDPDIIDIVATDNFPAILIRDIAKNNKLRLVLYKL